MRSARDAAGQLETEWLRQTAQGDRAAFERLFRAYEHRLYRYLLGLVRETQVAEELTGDTMLDVWRGAARYRAESKVSTWIFGIAHHKAIDALRRRGPEHIELHELAGVRDASPGPEPLALADSFRRDLVGALAELTPEHRAVPEPPFTHGTSQPATPHTPALPAPT